MVDLTLQEQLFAHAAKMTAQVAGFHEGMSEVGDKLVDALINIAGESNWQAQSLARQMVHIQVQLRAQLNQSGYGELAETFVNSYDESELFARRILQEIGHMTSQLIPMRSDTVANLKAFDLSRFDDACNGIIRSLSRELVFNTVGGKKRSDVIKSLTAEMNGQEEQATTLADTALRSFDRFVNNATYTNAGITHFKYFGPNDKVTRPFCKEHVNKVYGLDEIKKMSNGSSRFGNVLIYGGGPRCRHTWTPQVDTQDGEVIQPKRGEQPVPSSRPVRKDIFWQLSQGNVQ